MISWLETVIRPDGKWTNERVVIFTEYRDTQKWLFDHLASRGFNDGGRLEMLYGAQDSEERERIKAAFQYDPKESAVRIPPAQEPDRRPPATTWNASSVARMAQLLQATRIVTFNLKHFPNAALDTWSVEALHPDDFLIDLYYLNPEVVIHTLHEQAADIGKGLEYVLSTLQRAAPKFVKLISETLDVTSPG